MERGAERKNALEKAFLVLEVVASPHAPHRLADIATRVGLPKSTVHRILQILSSDGYVAAVADGSYAVGPNGLALAGKMLASSDLRAIAEPILEQLQRSTGTTVHFATRSGHMAVYAAKFDGGQPYRMASRVGVAIPLHCTSIGKAILAALPMADARRILESTPLVSRTANTRTTLAALFEDLDEVRRRGFAIDDEENEQNVRCVGAAVYDSAGRVIGGVSVSSLAFEFTRADALAVGPRVQAAASAITVALGGSRSELETPAVASA